MKLSDIQVTERVKQTEHDIVCAHFMSDDTCDTGCSAERVKKDGKCPFEVFVQKTCNCYTPKK